jgi:hypothetical protein
MLRYDRSLSPRAELLRRCSTNTPLRACAQADAAELEVGGEAWTAPERGGRCIGSPIP